MFREAEFSVRTGREIREDQNITSKQQVERKKSRIRSDGLAIRRKCRGRRTGGPVRDGLIDEGV